jgi:hypothetical protein
MKSLTKQRLRVVDCNYEAHVTDCDIPVIKKYIDGEIVEYINIDDLTSSQRSKYIFLSPKTQANDKNP